MDIWVFFGRLICFRICVRSLWKLELQHAAKHTNMSIQDEKENTNKK